ncbi:aldo/keto reductase [Prolixibacter sp. SD074]|jgi:aryl-alcohol dehydrogenase-like predicted oxidoreductase|uniref:aldo/keto reductase n=1 Tax=Prolixibacter sp. SD074 TaxID=2652391 RepID=UPI0012790D5C|nr:aldo/keto reductase [Prolixibacter sp. SD074]GET30899.1 oxidoreductase [Prolixibacter sp. SD074]
MLKRKIGNSDLEVFPIGLGAMGMSEFYGNPEDQESIKTLHAALEHGINFIDTADMYGIGRNELLLNKALHDRWDKVVLASKFGIVRDEKEGRGLNGKPEYVKQACEASLKRLGREAIDLYYLHRVDPQTPIEETVGAMAELVKEGKVRYLGLSEVSGDTLKRANAVHPITAVQSEYSLWSQDVEGTTLPTCRELGVGFVAYSPLGRGFLTGRFKSIDDLEPNDHRRFSPRFQGNNFAKNLELVKLIGKLAEKKGCQPSQLALAWLLHQGEDIFPIPGTTKQKHLLSNIQAVNIKLSAEDVKEINSIMTNIHGDRYDETGMKQINA